MPTETDLRRALTELADSAPHPGRIRLVAPAHRARRRPLLVVAAVLAALALVAAVLPYVVQRAADPADRRVDGFWAMISRVDPPPGWQVTQRLVSVEYELTGLSRTPVDPGTASTCEVRVFGRGLVPPALLDGSPDRVGDRPAIWSAPTEVESARLTWAYDTDAYASVSCIEDSVDQDAYRSLAEATRFDETTDLHLPFRLTGLPDGCRVGGVGEFGAEPLRPGVMGWGDDCGFDLIVDQAPFEPAGPGMPGIEELTVRGYPAVVREDLRGLQLTVPTSAGLRYPTVRLYGTGDQKSWAPGERERLQQIAAALRFADDLNDPDTWFTARRAIP